MKTRRITQIRKAHKMAFFSLCPMIALLFCLKMAAGTICSIKSSTSGSSRELHGFLFLPLWHSFSHDTTHDTVALASLCLGHHGYFFLIADQTIFVERQGFWSDGGLFAHFRREGTSQRRAPQRCLKKLTPRSCPCSLKKRTPNTSHFMKPERLVCVILVWHLHL